MWIILAEPTPQYLKFLRNTRDEKKPRAFLHLHLHGRLDIFQSADILLFGFLISAITHQISKEVVPGYDTDKKKEDKKREGV